MHFLLNIGIFHSYVSLPEGINHLKFHYKVNWWQLWKVASSNWVPWLPSKVINHPSYDGRSPVEPSRWVPAPVICRLIAPLIEVNIIPGKPMYFRPFIQVFQPLCALLNLQLFWRVFMVQSITWVLRWPKPVFFHGKMGAKMVHLPQAARRSDSWARRREPDGTSPNQKRGWKIFNPWFSRHMFDFFWFGVFF